MASIFSGKGGTPFRRIARIDRMPVLLLTVIGLFGCGDGAGAQDGGGEAGANATHTGGRSGSGGAHVDGGAGRGAAGGGGSSAGAGGLAGGAGGAVSTGGSGAGGVSGTGGRGGATTGTGGSAGGTTGAGGVIGSGGTGAGTGGRGTGGQTSGTGGLGTGGQSTGTGGLGTGGHTTGTGGLGTGGQSTGTGGTGTGGRGTGGTGTGGTGTGGTGTGGTGTGGTGTGGTGTGGTGTGGTGTGGTGTGGTGTGGTGTGGMGTGGTGTGGTGTGGTGTGGTGTGGTGTGGTGTGGTGTGGTGTGGTGTGGTGTGGTGTGGQGAGGDATLYTVGHPDDELLFINPDLEADIQAGRKVRVVYVTSGDLSDNYLSREAEVRAAGAAMAGVNDNWSCASVTYAGKAVLSCTLVARPTVTSLFMRIGDGQVMNVFLGGTATTADNSSTYDQAQTLAVLSAILAEFQPTRVGTLDGTLAYGDEHTDHIATAFFTFDVARADGVARQLTMYRGYTMYADPPPPAPMPANLSVAQYAEKLRIMEVYNGPISSGDIYDQWCQRFYPVVATPGGPGPLRANGGLCLAPTGSGNGAPLQVATCDGSAGQTWTAGGNSRVMSAGKCLGVANDGTTAVLEACTGGADQTWTLMGSGQLKGPRDSCLTVVYGTTVQSQGCTSQPNADNPPLFFPPTSQQWGF